MKFVTDILNKYNPKKKWIDWPLDWSGDGEYNINLVKSLILDERQVLRYIARQRIELDHVIDTVGPQRFFDYIKSRMEDEFLFRDYNYAVEPATVDKIRPKVVRELCY